MENKLLQKVSKLIGIPIIQSRFKTLPIGYQRLYKSLIVAIFPFFIYFCTRTLAYLDCDSDYDCLKYGINDDYYFGGFVIGLTLYYLIIVASLWVYDGFRKQKEN